MPRLKWLGQWLTVGNRWRQVMQERNIATEVAKATASNLRSIYNIYTYIIYVTIAMHSQTAWSVIRQLETKVVLPQSSNPSIPDSDKSSWGPTWANHFLVDTCCPESVR